MKCSNCNLPISKDEEENYLSSKDYNCDKCGVSFVKPHLLSEAILYSGFTAIFGLIPLSLLFWVIPIVSSITLAGIWFLGFLVVFQIEKHFMEYRQVAKAGNEEDRKHRSDKHSVNLFILATPLIGLFFYILFKLGPANS